MAAKNNLYPLFILLLLGSFICFLAWSAMRAADSGPEVTDADYYSKGLKYNNTLVEKRAAAVLGWSVTTRLVGRSLEFHLNDNQGQPVSAASGILFIYLHESTTNLQIPLQETGPGIYLLHLTDNMKGRMNARVEFVREGARLNRRLLLNL